MKILNASLVFGPILLIGALPVSAGPAIHSDTNIQLAAGSTSTDDRGSYVQRAQSEMQEWKKKVHDFSEKAEAKGKQAGNTAEEDLNKAWAKTEAASHRLQEAGADGWDSAKSAFEGASNELKQAWHKVHPED